MIHKRPAPYELTVSGAWLLAMRPKTLLAGAVPVMVGIAAAVSNDVVKWGPSLGALVAAILIQIGANFANDLFDFRKGSDTDDRLGPIRVSRSGLLTSRQIVGGIYVSFGSASLIGVYLVWVGGWPILAIGVLSILAGITYSGGSLAYGYRGLGDLAVFLFFGVFAVNGTYYIQALSFDWLAVWACIPVGALATAILTVNNLRDIDTDRATGKVTLAVRMGVLGTQKEYIMLLILAFLVPLAMWGLGVVGPEIMLTWIVAPYGVWLARSVCREHGRSLNRVLERTAQLELIYGMLFSGGLIFHGQIV